MNNRFSCLKSSGEEKKPTRRNRFQKPRTNNRWKRSKSPTERTNTFKVPKRERGGRHFRHKKRGGESKLFKNTKKDALGRPMIAGATTGGFDFGLALQMSKNKNSKKDKKNKSKSKSKPVEKEETVEENILTEQEQKNADEWKKHMILNMQYDMDITEEEFEEFYVECDFCGVRDIDSCDLPLGVCNLAEIGRGYAHESCMPAKVMKEYQRSLYV